MSRYDEQHDDRQGDCSCNEDGCRGDQELPAAYIAIVLADINEILIADQFSSVGLCTVFAKFTFVHCLMN